jgi:hypothetical protein
LQIGLILRGVGRDFEVLKSDVFLIDPVRRPRFKSSPQMAFAIEIWQHKALGFMADRQGNVR